MSVPECPWSSSRSHPAPPCPLKVARVSCLSPVVSLRHGATSQLWACPRPPNESAEVTAPSQSLEPPVRGTHRARDQHGLIKRSLEDPRQSRVFSPCLSAGSFALLKILPRDHADTQGRSVPSGSRTQGFSSWLCHLPTPPFTPSVPQFTRPRSDP